MGKIGIFGKHPAFGDFIGAGMSKPMQVALEEWLGAVLPRVRDNLGEVWQPFYDIALPLRFWLGEGVSPRGLGRPVAGVLVFSHDKVGRRFPLIALREVGDMPPPVVVPDQRWYDTLQARMLEHDTPDTAGELAEMLDLADGFLPPSFEGGDAAFWAVHSAGQVEELMANVAATDHRRAAARRSYWWCAGDASRTATFHTLEGWPDAAVLQWLIAGNPGEAEPEPVAEPAPEPEADVFLEAAPVAAAVAVDAWADGGMPKVPPALYVEEAASSGPESPFSIRESVEAEPEVETEDAPEVEVEEEVEPEEVPETETAEDDADPDEDLTDASEDENDEDDTETEELDENDVSEDTEDDELPKDGLADEAE